MTASSQIRQAVILAGGRGSRLGALTATCPKPLLHVAGRPFLDRLILWLAMAGIDEIILATGYRAEGFADFIAKGQVSGRWHSPEGRPIRVWESREPQPLGTAGALSLLAGRIEKRFFLLNGDSLFDCDPVALALRAESLPAGQALMALRQVEDAGRFGRVQCNASGRIDAFTEKGQSGPGVINAGITILPQEVLARIGTGAVSLEEDIYPALAREGLLHGMQATGFFIDIGLPASLDAAQTGLPQALRRPAVFFDRDGVLNHDDGYSHRPEALALIEGAAEAAALARQAGYRSVVVTNQAGIGHGLFSEAQMQDFHQALNQALRRSGGWIDAFYHCPYHPKAKLAAYRHPAHPDRKPQPGMILRALRDLGLRAAGSVLIGDRESDLIAAHAAGIAARHYTAGSVAQVLRQHLQPRAALTTEAN